MCLLTEQSYLHCNAHYNLIEYSDNYSDTLGSLWQFERPEVPADNTGNFSTDNSELFK